MFLEGKIAAVTGSGKGIGKAIALDLAKEGCNVVITSRTKIDITNVVKEIESLGVKSIGVVSDVSNYESAKGVVTETMKTFGKIDILVNNAGIALKKDFIETEKEEWDKIIDINVKGVFNFTRDVLPIMKFQKSGVIINISSGAGKTGIPGLSVYCASKFALVGFTEAVAQEVENDGVRVFCLCPGSTDTGMFSSLFPGVEAVSKPEDISKQVLKLCKPNCDIETGSILDVF